MDAYGLQMGNAEPGSAGPIAFGPAGILFMADNTAAKIFAVDVADPGESHAAKLIGILGISITAEQVSAKFKYGGNVDELHRRAVVEHLLQRGGPGDDAAADHVMRRLQS